MEEVALHGDKKVLMEIDEDILPIVCDPQEILDHQLSLHPIYK
jgi:hypothetical protein